MLMDLSLSLSLQVQIAFCLLFLCLSSPHRVSDPHDKRLQGAERGRDTGWKWLIRVQSAQGCFLWLGNGPQSWDERHFKKSWGKVTSPLTEMEHFPGVDRSHIFVQQNTWLPALQTEKVNGFTFTHHLVLLSLVIVKC